MSRKPSKINLQRRQFLSKMAVGCALPIAAPLLSSPLLSGCSPALNKQKHKANQLWLSAAGNQANGHALAWSSPVNNSQQIQSDFRGHGLAIHASKPSQVVMVSRRPGNTGLVVDTQTQTTLARFNSPEHLFMEGHACFDLKGTRLFCSQSNHQTQQGVITVSNTQNYTIQQELSSGGIGPHEILMHPKQANTLIIANGGLIKDSQGKIVNGNSMESNISLLDFNTGKIKQRFFAQEKKASLRHMDVSSDGIIAVAMQVQRQFTSHQNLVPLTALIKDGEFIPLNAPENLLEKMNDYVGSVRINNKYRTAAFTSPRGDLALFWNIDSGEFLGQHFFHNVCGLTLTLDEEYFVMSNAAGKLRHIHGQTLLENRELRQHHAHVHWDNHMLTLANL